FEHRQVFRVQMRIMSLPGVQGEKERQIGVIGVQQPEPAKVESAVSRNDREKSVEQVITLLHHHSVMRAKELEALGDRAAQLGAVLVIEDNRERILAEIV